MLGVCYQVTIRYLPLLELQLMAWEKIDMKIVKSHQQEKVVFFPLWL